MSRSTITKDEAELFFLFVFGACGNQLNEDGTLPNNAAVFRRIRHEFFGGELEYDNCFNNPEDYVLSTSGNLGYEAITVTKYIKWLESHHHG